jgi:hypothetical protein
MSPHMYPETLTNVNVKSPAEKLLFEVFESQLDENFHVLHSVAWIEIRRKGNKPSDGEIDFVILHPKMGILLLEVKGGLIGRDENSHWYTIRKDGTQADIKNPFEQVKENKYALIKKLRSLPNWTHDLPTIGHAVAFPDGTIDDLEFGADIPSEIVMLHNHLGNTGKWLSDCFKFWASGSYVSPGDDGVQTLLDLFKRSWFMREPRLGEELDLEKSIIDRYTEEQFALLDWLAGRPRAAIRGCAGSGKTLLAIKKAEQLAKEGFRTLVTCYNRNLADYLNNTIGRKPRIKVRSFHGLCQEYAEKTGRNKKPDWDDRLANFYDSIMPEALYEAAICGDDDFKFDAIVVDEGQDFNETWWTGLEMLLEDPANGVFFIFYDDNQLVYSRRANLPVQEAPFSLNTNCRNTKKIHEVSTKYYQSDLKIRCKGPEGRDPRTTSYSEFPFSPEAALTEILARLVYEQNVHPADIVILSSNGRLSDPMKNIEAAGAFLLVEKNSLHSNEIQSTTIRQFKGLEKPVVILVCPPQDQLNFTELMYVGTSRAINHLELLIRSNSD